MKRLTISLLLVLSFATGGLMVATAGNEKWGGIDEAVLEKFAADAGRVPAEPFFNTDQGDLLLFFFFLFGSAAGFIAGYFFRELFPPKEKKGKLNV